MLLYHISSISPCIYVYLEKYPSKVENDVPLFSVHHCLTISKRRLVTWCSQLNAPYEILTKAPYEIHMKASYEILTEASCEILTKASYEILMKASLRGSDFLIWKHHEIHVKFVWTLLTNFHRKFIWTFLMNFIWFLMDSPYEFHMKFIICVCWVGPYDNRELFIFMVIWTRYPIMLTKLCLSI